MVDLPPRSKPFPTRRSSDLDALNREAHMDLVTALEAEARAVTRSIDRKSTRLNSSHLGISYAVFCLKKKKMDRLAGYSKVSVLAENDTKSLASAKRKVAGGM